MSAITEETLSVSGMLLSQGLRPAGARRSTRFREENQRLADLAMRQQMIGRTFFAVVGDVLLASPRPLVYLVAG